MTDNSGTKTVVLSRDVVKDLRGNAACEAVAKHVHETLNLPTTDNNTRIVYWDSALWNTPASMVKATGKGSRVWNGGFATKLGAALNGHVAGETRPESAPATSNAPATAPKQASTKTVAVLKVEFDLEGGIASCTLGENGAFRLYSIDGKLGIDAELATLAVWSRRIVDIASDPWRWLAGSVETRNGAVISAGWVFGPYTSAAQTAVDAGKEIAKKVVDALDMNNMGNIPALVQGQLVERQGDGVKAAWIEKYRPVAPAPETAPAEPTETPMTETEAAQKFATGELSEPATMQNPAQTPAPIMAGARIAK